MDEMTIYLNMLGPLMKKKIGQKQWEDLPDYHKTRDLVESEEYIEQQGEKEAMLIHM